MAIKENRQVFVYSEKLDLLKEYESVNTASQKLEIPKTSLLSTLDKRVTNVAARTIKSKRIWCDLLNQYVILKSTKIQTSRRIFGM